MIWLYIALGVLAGLALLVLAVGSLLPKSHVVSRTLRSNQSPEAVWQVINDFANVPSWHPEVKVVERLPDCDGRAVWRETYKGNMPLQLETLEAVPPRRLVRSIRDEKGPFSGRWEFDIAPAQTGSRITITERGEVANPFFRFMARLFMNPAMYIDQYLTALARKFGEPAAIN